MGREDLDKLYDLLDDFYITYAETEEQENLIINILSLIQNELKISDCWNIRKAG